MSYALQEYMKTSTYDILGNKRLVNRLRTECRKAKEALSFNASSYNIHVSIIKIIEVVNYKNSVRRRLRSLFGFRYTINEDKV